MNKEIESIKKDIQEALNKGWEEFPALDIYPVLDSYTKSLLEDEVYNKKYRKVIPNPGHEMASRLIGKYFPQVLIKHLITCDQFFPGDFDKSVEGEIDGIVVRKFYLNAYREGKFIFTIEISWPHKHDEFAFPEPPIVKLLLDSKPV